MLIKVLCPCHLQVALLQLTIGDKPQRSFKLQPMQNAAGHMLKWSRSPSLHYTCDSLICGDLHHFLGMMQGVHLLNPRLVWSLAIRESSTCFISLLLKYVRTSRCKTGKMSDLKVLHETHFL